MIAKKKIAGFLHYRTDLGDGVRTGVVFSDCSESCSLACSDFFFQSEHPFEDAKGEESYYSSEELAAYLLEEKTLYYTKPLGITFLGREPLRDPFFCKEVAKVLKEAKIDLSVVTCGMCSDMAFDLLDGLVDLYVLRLFSLTPQSLHTVKLLEERGKPFRLLIPVCPDYNQTLAEDLSFFAQGLRSLKSVILDFSHSTLSPIEIKAYRGAFLSKGVVLY